MFHRCEYVPDSINCSNVRHGVILAEARVETKRCLAARNRRARDHELAHSLLLRRLQRSRVLDLDLDAAQRHAKVAVLARRAGNAVVVHVCLGDGASDGRGCESVDDACLCVDTQVGEVLSAQGRCVEAGALGGED